MEIEKISLISSLFDIYKNLLTEKQKQVISNYVFSNLSFSEIAEIENISRQAVKDLLDRTITLLYSYEEKLKIFEKLTKTKEYIKEDKIKEYNRIWEE